MAILEFGIGLILFGGQLNTLQPKAVVHLPPHKNAIEARFDRDLVELINAPEVVHLPVLPPKPDANGVPWSVEVKNLGPAQVTISNDMNHFKTLIQVGETLQIQSTGSQYVLKR